IIREPVTITDERELLTLFTTWAPRRLRVVAEILNACEHEAAITALIAAAIPKMERGAMVEIGDIGRPSSRNLVRQALAAIEPEEKLGAALPPVNPAVTTVHVVAEQAARPRGPRLGRRVDPDELRQRLR